MDSAAVETWKAILGDLQLQVSRPIYETWLKETEGLSITDGSLTVGVPTPFAVEWLERRMYQSIQEDAAEGGRPAPGSTVPSRYHPAQ